MPSRPSLVWTRRRATPALMMGRWIRPAGFSQVCEGLKVSKEQLLQCSVFSFCVNTVLTIWLLNCSLNCSWDFKGTIMCIFNPHSFIFSKHLSQSQGRSGDYFRSTDHRVRHAHTLSHTHYHQGATNAMSTLTDLSFITHYFCDVCSVFEPRFSLEAF